MTVETLAHSTKTTRQRRALESYVAKLEEALRGQSRGGTASTVVSVDGFSLALDPWITARMQPLGTASHEEFVRTELVRQAVALWLKILVDLRKLGDGLLSGCVNLYELQAELMLDSGFGSSILRELQDNVDALVKHGNIEEARRFSKLQRHVRGIVRDMKQSLTDSNAMPADEPADEAADEPTAQPTAQPAVLKPALAPATERVVHEADRAEPAPRPRRRPRPRPQAAPTPTAVATPARSRGPSRTTILVALNAVALVAYLALTAPFVTPRRTLRSLVLGDFPNVTPLIEVQARPPALYAIVDGKAWSGFDDKEKRRFVDGIGSVLLTEGYGGLLLKTADGRLVGDWLEHGGTRVFDAKPVAPVNPANPSAPAQPSALASVNGVAPQFSRFVP